MIEEMETKYIAMVNPGRWDAIEQDVTQYHINGNNRVCPHVLNRDPVASGLHKRVVGMGIIPALNHLMIEVGLGQHAGKVLHIFLMGLIGVGSQQTSHTVASQRRYDNQHEMHNPWQCPQRNYHCQHTHAKGHTGPSNQYQAGAEDPVEVGLHCEYCGGG
jgi:hypothetical protein